MNRHITRHDPVQCLRCHALNTIWNIWSLTVLRSAFNGWRQQGRARRAARLRCCRTSTESAVRRFKKHIGSTKQCVWRKVSVMLCFLNVSHVSLIVRRDIHQTVRLRVCCITVGWSCGQLGRSFFWWLQQACTKGPAGNMCWRFEIISLMSAGDFHGDVGSSILAHILLELSTVSYCMLCLHARWPFANHVFVGWNCFESLYIAMIIIEKTMIILSINESPSSKMNGNCYGYCESFPPRTCTMSGTWPPVPVPLQPFVVLWARWWLGGASPMVEMLEECRRLFFSQKNCCWWHGIYEFVWICGLKVSVKLVKDESI